jgi:dihydrofolate reductase
MGFGIERALLTAQGRIAFDGGQAHAEGACRLALAHAVVDCGHDLGAQIGGVCSHPSLCNWLNNYFKCSSTSPTRAAVYLHTALPLLLGWLPYAITVREGRHTMARLIYSAITSLDGYVTDEEGNFDWAAPDEDVHAFVNDLERPIGTYLYGRRMYDTMLYWETAHTLADQPAVAQDFTEIWRAADKVVYSRTLDTVSSARTRIVRDFDPEAVRQMKARAGRDISVGGPALAAQAIKAGLVDEVQLFLTPIVVGGGNRAFPYDVRLNLELVDERRFGTGVVYVRYRIET